MADGRISFQSATGSDSFDQPLSAVQEVHVNLVPIDGHRAFHIRLASGVNYNFIPQTDPTRVVNAVVLAKRSAR